jgi:hypothetical protein
MRMKRIACASLASLLLVTVVLTITGALYEMIGRWRDALRFPQRGRLVQVGSIRMNIDCSGQEPLQECLSGESCRCAKKRHSLP